ncbi:MAG TPA: hypothetical protein VFY93_00380 [Planctomycetota bacterium]|nr:hypothetical protein [Planctomycetota bacterium]
MSGGRGPFALLLLAAVAGAESGIEWQKSLDGAKKAAAEKRPIAVLLRQKGCPLTAELLKNLDKDERIAELAPSFAWLSVSVGADEYKDWFVPTCGGNVEGTPSLLFLNPRGENADPEYAGLPTLSTADPDEIVPVLREVLQRAKQEEPARDKAAVAAAVERANAAKTPGGRIAAWRAALRAGDGWRGEEQLMEEARAAIRTILQEGGAEMLRILREVRDVDGQRKAYETVREGYAGTSIADWAADEIARLPKK